MNEKISRRSFLGKAAVLSAFTIVPRHVLGGAGFLAPSDKITLGFIGCGKQAFGLKGAFLGTGESEILGASDVYGHKLKAFLSGMNSCKAYPDFRDLLAAREIDAVVIATPDHWHGVMAVKAAAAGKDIYCEKPLSLTVAEGREMVKATRKYNRVFQTGSMQRSWKEFRDAAELVKGGYIGNIKTIKVSVGGPPVPYHLQPLPVPEDLNWDFWLGPNAYAGYHPDLAPALKDEFWGRWRLYKEFGGGGMTDWGAHMFDIAQWALDMDQSGPNEVIAPDGKDYPHLTYRYANGITMTHEDFGTNAVRFIGSEGQIDVERGRLTTNPASLKDKIPAGGLGLVYKSTDHYKDFFDAMRKRTRPVCDVETGHRTATVCNIGNIAYALKRSLKWDPVKERFNDKEANLLLSRKLRKEWSI